MECSKHLSYSVGLTEEMCPQNGNKPELDGAWVALPYKPSKLRSASDGTVYVPTLQERICALHCQPTALTPSGFASGVESCLTQGTNFPESTSTSSDWLRAGIHSPTQLDRIYSEKCILRQFPGGANIRVHLFNLDGEAHYATRPCGATYCSKATSLCSILRFKTALD